MSAHARRHGHTRRESRSASWVMTVVGGVLPSCTCRSSRGRVREGAPSHTHHLFIHLSASTVIRMPAILQSRGQDRLVVRTRRGCMHAAVRAGHACDAHQESLARGSVLEHGAVIGPHQAGESFAHIGPQQPCLVCHPRGRRMPDEALERTRHAARGLVPTINQHAAPMHFRRVALEFIYSR